MEHRAVVGAVFLFRSPLRQRRSSLAEHFSNLITKVPAREGILQRVLNSTWGLVVGVLKFTHVAVITSLLTYGLVDMI